MADTSRPTAMLSVYTFFDGPKHYMTMAHAIEALRDQLDAAVMVTLVPMKCRTPWLPLRPLSMKPRLAAVVSADKHGLSLSWVRDDTFLEAVATVSDLVAHVDADLNTRFEDALAAADMGRSDRSLAAYVDTHLLPEARLAPAIAAVQEAVALQRELAEAERLPATCFQWAHLLDRWALLDRELRRHGQRLRDALTAVWYAYRAQALMGDMIQRIDDWVHALDVAVLQTCGSLEDVEARATQHFSFSLCAAVT